MKIGTETYHTLKKVISNKYGIDGKCIYARVIWTYTDGVPSFPSCQRW